MAGRTTLATAMITALAPISWGTNFVVITETLPDDRPLLVATMRVVPPSLALVAVGWLTSRWRPRAGEWRRVALLALFNFGLFFPLLSVAVYRLPGGVAAAFGGLGPLLVAGIAWVVVRRQPRAIDVAVGVVAALGVGLVVLGPGAGFDGVGLLAALGANVSFAVAVVLTKTWPAPSDPVAATGWQLLLGGLALTPLTLVVEGGPPALTGESAAGYAYMGLVSTGVAYVLWFRGIRRLPAPAAPLLGLSAPVTSAALGWVLLDESLSVSQLLGFVLALGSIAYGATLVDRGDPGDPGSEEAAAAPVPGAEAVGTTPHAASDGDRPRTPVQYVRMRPCQEGAN